MTDIGFMAKPAKQEEKPRTQEVRRELNNAFYGFHDNDGNFSWAKFLAVTGQATCIVKMWQSFDELIKTPESLLIIILVIVFPDVLKMWIKLKWGAK